MLLPVLTPSAFKITMSVAGKYISLIKENGKSGKHIINIRRYEILGMEKDLKRSLSSEFYDKEVMLIFCSNSAIAENRKMVYLVK